MDIGYKVDEQSRKEQLQRSERWRRDREGKDHEEMQRWRQVTALRESAYCGLESQLPFYS